MFDHGKLKRHTLSDISMERIRIDLMVAILSPPEKLDASMLSGYTAANVRLKPVILSSVRFPGTWMRPISLFNSWDFPSVSFKNRNITGYTLLNFQLSF